MPTRQEVIQGLSAPSRIVSDPQCPICYEPSTDPVQLPCHYGHVFCRECVTTWLQSCNHNTCPTDKEKLFETEQAGGNSHGQTAAPSPRRTNYRYMVIMIAAIRRMVDSAPEHTLKVTVQEAMISLKNSLLNVDDFTGGTVVEFTANLSNVHDKLLTVLTQVRSISEHSRAYTCVERLLELEIDTCAQSIATAADGGT